MGCNVRKTKQQSFWLVDPASYRNQYQEYFLGVKAVGPSADNPTTFMSLSLL
jgi:hypothetical protein